MSPRKAPEKPQRPMEQTTPGRRKLDRLGIRLPFCPITTAGSLPKGPELKEVRYKVSHGVIAASEQERKEKTAAEAWIREQDRLGCDVLVDGEIIRGDMIEHFAGRIDGFTRGGLVRSAGNLYYRKPVVSGKIGWRGPITVEDWRFAQRLTYKPVKAVLTGPYTLADWSSNEYYSTRAGLCAELTQVLRKEAVALAEAGVKILQIDEPALSSRLHEFPLVADALRTILADMPFYVILQHAFGDIAPLWKKLQRLPVDNLAIDASYAPAALTSLLSLHDTTKDITVGIVDAGAPAAEPKARLIARVRNALKALPPGAVWIAPDSGMKGRTPEEARAIIRSLADTAGALRTEAAKKKAGAR